MSGSGDFWSRRKARVQAEAEAEAAEAVRAQEAAELAEREAQSDDEILQELGLPDPDTLQPGDDFSGFMARAVPERLRRRALRKLWLSNPVLANVDGLVEYGENYTDQANVIEGLQTAYQVGKGMLAHVQEMARQAEAEAEAGAGAEATEESQGDVPVEETEPEVSLDSDDKKSQSEGNSEHPPVTAAAEPPVARDEHEDIAPAPRRRMRFAFATDNTGDISLEGKEHA